MSRFVSEPLPDYPFQEFFSPRGVVGSLSTPMIVPEIELRKIAVKMLFFAVLVHAFHASLEDREVPFRAVGVDGAICQGDILSIAVLDNLMV